MFLAEEMPGDLVVLKLSWAPLKMGCWKENGN